MNTVNPKHVRVDKESMESFLYLLAQKAGMPEQKAAFLSKLLVKNDLRGIFSHGSRQMATYARIIRDNGLNPDPEVKIVSDSSSTIVLDGDGGLGYYAAYAAAENIVDRCRNSGIAAVVTKNHGHIGAAGIYARLLAEQKLISFVTSGHQLNLCADHSIMRAAGGSPMAFGVPAGNQPPMVLDFGTMHDLYEGSPHVTELFSLAPGMVFRSMGLGFICQAMGGFLAGIPLYEDRALRLYKEANQGALIIALEIGRFFDFDKFKSEMDAYIEMAGNMQPMPGYKKAYLSGILEYHREKDWSISGIPVDDNHRSILSNAAVEFDLELPF